MNSQQKLLFLYCEENLHAGAGSSTGTIDLPIQREGHTTYPKIESSTLRGAIREAVNERIQSAEKDKFESIFGKWKNADQQSAVDFPDAKLLLFPIRSYKGVFAWITCPFVLKRFKKDYKNWSGHDLAFDIENIGNPHIIVQTDSEIKVNNEVMLEEFLFSIAEDRIFPIVENMDLGIWLANKLGNTHGIIEDMGSKLAIVSDDVFRDFVNLYTVKITRNKISPETGTADGGALFNEEFLPSESLLYSFVLASDEFKKDGLKATVVMDFFVEKMPELFRLGGDKGIGKGLMRQALIDFPRDVELKTVKP